MADSTTNLTRSIRKEAARLGFSAIGFSSPLPQPLAIKRYNTMIAEKRHAGMSYMEQRVDERAMPSMLLPGIKTIISAAISYHHPLHNHSEQPNISKYALIDDYHTVVRKKLEELLESIKTLIGDNIKSTITVDSAPVLEKTWAEHAGIGKTGKNTLLIVPAAGSYIFLGEILIDKEIIDNKPPLPNLCGSCNKCLEICPTGALIEPGKLDASKCISYLTVELKRDFTTDEAEMIGNHLFGCDHCQEVCPHNKQASITANDSFAVRNNLQNITTETILNLTKSTFRKLFYGTPIFRVGLKRIKRNAKAVEINLKKQIQ
ncbi:MAG: tRNA epoxyqueuosine(34) reductase QueG [Chlorobiales bacterium]|nr:tRNA epoxyqueuosine(34) reductase QueG [Chlorobiales bacterium]